MHFDYAQLPSGTLSYRQVRSVTVRYAQLPSGSVTGYSAITDRHRRHPWVIRQNFLDLSIEGSDRDFFEIFLRVIEEAPTFSNLFKIYKKYPENPATLVQG